MGADRRDLSVSEVHLTQEGVVFDRVHGVTLTSADVGDGRDVFHLEAALVVVSDESYDVGRSNTRGFKDVLCFAETIRSDVDALTRRPVTQNA